MTPRTSSAARPGRARPARPASSGRQPQRGSPTSTSISTVGARQRRRRATVSGESTATVIRASRRVRPAQRSRVSVQGLVRQQQVVAQPGRRPCPPSPAAWRSRTSGDRPARRRGGPARCVLNALTWGRSAGPGSDRGHHVDVVVQGRAHRPAAPAWARSWTFTPPDGTGRAASAGLAGGAEPDRPAAELEHAELGAAAAAVLAVVHVQSVLGPHA